MENKNENAKKINQEEGVSGKQYEWNGEKFVEIKFINSRPKLPVSWEIEQKVKKKRAEIGKETGHRPELDLIANALIETMIKDDDCNVKVKKYLKEYFAKLANDL